MRAKLQLVLAGIAALVAACDPCATTISCTQSPAAKLVGQIVDENTGRPVSGARLEMRYQSGTSLQPTVAETHSSADGSFEIGTAASGLGQTTVSVSIAAPGKPSYVVADLSLQTSARRGEATVVPPWVSAHPAFPVVIVVRYTDGTPIADAQVVFQRSGGSLLYAADMLVPRLQGTTGSDGYLFLFNGITTDTTGNVIGDLSVQLPGGTLVLPGYAFTAVPRFRQPHSFAVIEISP